MHIYISQQALGFKFRITITEDDEKKDVLIQFKNGEFKTDNAQIAERIDKLLDERHGISVYVRKVDKAAAEKLAKEHMDRLSRTGAISGGVTAGAVKKAIATDVDARDQELQKKADANIRELAADKENLVLTMKGETHASSGLLDAGKSTVVHDQVDVNAEAVKGVSLKLGN
jgi:hypothetical protein